MQLKDFIGKVVIATHSGRRMFLTEITAPAFQTVTIQANDYGHRTYYSWPTINGNAFETGYLVFEDKTLLKPFLECYADFLRTEDAYWEEFDYWMRRS